MSKYADRAAERLLVYKAKEMLDIMNHAQDVKDNPVKRLEWRSTLQDIIEYLEYEE